MTLNFTDTTQNFTLAVMLLMLAVAVTMACGQLFRTKLWKQRATALEKERDEYAAKYFAVQEEFSTYIRLAAIEAEREPERESESAMVAPHIRMPVPGSSQHTKRRVTITVKKKR